MNWQFITRVEFFMDFEIFSNIFDDFSNLPHMGGQIIVFMIGLGVSIRHEGKVKWEYYNFRVAELTNEAEFQILTNVIIRWMTYVIYFKQKLKQ